MEVDTTVVAPKVTYEALLAEGETMDELLKTQEGICKLVEAFQNSFKTQFIYLQPSKLINQMVLDKKLLMEIKGGLKCYAIITIEENSNGNNSQ